MSSENRYQAFQKLVQCLSDSDDPLSANYDSSESVLDDALSMLRPFLLNPERHENHIRVILEHAGNSLVLGSMSPMLAIFNAPLLRKLPSSARLRRNLAEEQTRFQQRVAELQHDLVNTTEPGELKVDALPLRSLPTHRDWLAQDLRLVQVETKTAVSPAHGFELQSVTHRIEVVAPSGAQFEDTIPSSAVESIGSREWSVSSKGRFVRTDTVGAEIGASGGVGAAKVSSKLSGARADQTESERSGSVKETRTARLHRVISTAIRSTAQWELLPTPTQTLRGGSTYVASLLVPADTPKVELRLELFARLEGWGPASHDEVRTLPVPILEMDNGAATQPGAAS